MTKKIVLIGTEARDKLIKGADFLADAVKSTLGPSGMNAVMEKGRRVTNDGISIAKEISLPDEIEDLGVTKLREACSRTAEMAGDGTTTAIVLSQAILHEALKQLPSEKRLVGKMTPPQVIKKIKEESITVIEKLKEMAETIDSEQKLIEVAMVSVEDQRLAELIGKTQWELGKDGTILPEESNEKEDTIERINGIRFDNGYGTSMVVNNPEKQTLEVEKCYVIFTNHTLESLKPLVGVLSQMANNSMNPIVIIARAFTSQAILDCQENTKNGLHIYPVNAPYTNQSQVFKDIQAVIGGRYIDQEDSNLEDMQLSDIGFANKIVASRFNTIIIGNDDDKAKERVTKRIETLESELKGAESPFEQNEIGKRLAMLKGGFALMKVCAASETERGYKKDKVDDAVNAVKAALEEGVVSGAGQALKTIAESLPEDSLIKPALMAPYKQIMVNAGGEFPVPEWVKDSVKVVRIGLEQACSVAATLATTHIAIATERPKPIDELLRK